MLTTNRTFRIFVSSTFSDLKAERNALQARVFPRLRELCEQRGARFQAVDLRWGVSEEASLDQQTMNICLGEIARCQLTSPRPNFVLLMGDRYGWRPPPPQIPASEFESILEQTVGAEDKALLEHWYRRDDNAILPEYCLQPRSGEYAIYEHWESVERRLQTVIESAVKQLKLSHQKLIKYVASATEQEIVTGALRVADACDHVFCFFREIRNLPSDLRAKGYIDLDESELQDHEAVVRMHDLKARLEEYIPENIYSYEASWEDGRISIEHLERLCEEVYQCLSKVIMDELSLLEEANPLDVEVNSHKTFKGDLARNFTGRISILQDIREYLGREDQHPMAVWGESGSGKSALMARAMQNLEEEIDSKAHPESSVIERFIGATPASSNIRSLLANLCEQINRMYDKDPFIAPGDFNELVHAFHDRLNLATREKPLVIFLDALDQLTETENAHQLTWMLSELPDNVKLVVTTLPEPFKCLAALRNKLPSQNLIKLEPLSAQDGESMLNALMESAGRTLQVKQQQEVLSKFEANGLPLYLKLAFEEARRWHSYDGVPDYEGKKGLAGDIPGIIRNLFWRLSDPANHGEILVSHSLAYLAAAKNGLSEDELLVILSQDEEVFQDFLARAFHKPPEEHLPVVLWSRLYFDLAPYLTERIADGAMLITFYHRQLEEVVREDYLTSEVRANWHEELAQYFKGQDLQSIHEGEWVPNLRKLSELPYQQAHAKSWEQLEQTLANYNFLEAKLWAVGPHLLIDDFEEGIQSGYAGEILPLIKDALQLSTNTLGEDPFQLPPQLLGRLLGNEKLGDLNLLEEARHWRTSSWLRPISASLTQPGGLLKRTLTGHTQAVRAVAVTPDGQHIISASDDQTLKVWDLNQGLDMDTLTGHTGALRAVAVTPDGRHVISSSSNGRIKVWDLEQGSEVHTFTVPTRNVFDKDVFALAVTPDGRYAISGATNDNLTIWDLELRKEGGTLAGHEDWIRTVAVTPDGRYALSGSDDKTIRVWDLAKGNVNRLKGHTDFVLAVAVTPDGQRAISGSKNGQILVWDLARGKTLHKLKGHKRMVRTLAVSPDGRLAFSGSDDRTIKVWDIEKGKEVQTISGLTGSVSGLAVTPDGKSLVSSSTSGALKVWDLTQPMREQRLAAHTLTVWAVDVSPDGKLAVSASADKTLKVWDLENASLLYTLPTDHEGHIASVVITQDGRYAVSGAGDADIKVWDLQRKKKVATLSGHRSVVWGLGLIPNTGLIISASHDRTLKVWDLKRKKCILTLSGHKGAVECVAVTLDGLSAISGSADGMIKVWDLKRGVEVRTLYWGIGAVLALALTPDGNRVISSHEGGTLKLWDLGSGEHVKTLTGHEKPVESVAVTPDGRQVISASNDRTIKVWDLDSGRAEVTFIGDSEQISCAYAPDGAMIIAGENLGKVHFLRLEQHLPGETIASIHRRPPQIERRILPGLGKFTPTDYEKLEALLVDVFQFLAGSDVEVKRSELADFNSLWAKNQTMEDSLFTGLLPQLVKDRGEDLLIQGGAATGTREMPITPPGRHKDLGLKAVRFRAFLREKLTDDEYRKFFISLLAWSEAVARALAGQYRMLDESSEHEKAVRALGAAFPMDLDLKLNAAEIDELADLIK